MAPTSSASRSFAGTRSTAITGSAPTIAAPITADSPTPPSPSTATESCARTPAVFVTAPTPVATQQPINAATSGGVWGSTGTAAWAGTTARSARVPIER